ncbi:helix-turn-helix domain-containing protein [Paraclostridium bifermentans]|uniref:helix-turn-helix domain-containing protein n=1 Tax=Paraclostridium bifermentans TaxID=1490 RepID=UPI00189783E4|nr:helix-turn-helix transcriptional regulator [Paraclostridium bifermentans]
MKKSIDEIIKEFEEDLECEVTKFDVNTRILIIRKFVDITQDSFAREIGLKRNSVALIERGERNPSDKTLKEIRTRFNVNKEWLLHGTGKVFNDDQKDHYLFNLCGKLCNSDNDLLKDTFIQVMNLDEKYLKMFNAMLNVVLSQKKE